MDHEHRQMVEVPIPSYSARSLSSDVSQCQLLPQCQVRSQFGVHFHEEPDARIIISPTKVSDWALSKTLKETIHLHSQLGPS